MKLLLTGATGIVGTECVRLALIHPAVTEVVALARRPVSVPDGLPSEADKSKLKTVIVQDFAAEYPEDVKEQIKGADACIWNLALIPSKAKAVTVEEAKRVCHDFTLVGLRSIMSVANPDHPFRFIYTSGAMTERNQDRSLWVLEGYRKMRGAVENAVLDEATNSNGRLEVQITKPGAIYHSSRGVIARAAMPVVALAGMPNLHVSEVGAAELDQAMNGFDDNDTLEVVDLVRIGQKALKQWGIQKSSF